MIVKGLRAFGLFWYDFIVGDDWLLAVGVIVALGVTAVIAHLAKAPSWWLLPVVVVGVIAVSVLRASRKALRKARPVPTESEAVTMAEKLGSD